MKAITKIAAASLAALALAGCTDADGAIRALEAAGYTDIHITGYRLFGCSDDDWVRTGFAATGADGKLVSGIVCSGLFFKGQTIRTE